MVAAIAPAVLDAVSAFMYGMTRLVDAMEGYERAGRELEPGSDEAPREAVR